jgi:hypothetical protein
MARPASSRIFPPARALLAAVALGGCLLVPAASLAEKDDIAAAANAFSRAQRAELSGDHERAAQLYELADSIAPTPEAVRSALRARLAAGHKSLAASRAEALLSRYPEDPESKALAERTLADLGKQIGRFEVACQPKPCALLVDGEAAGTEPLSTHVIYLDPGAHELVAAFGERRTEPKSVEARAGERQSVAFSEPPAPPAGTLGGAATTDALSGPKASEKGGLSPLFFVAGASLTAGLGIVTIWSGFDTLEKRDEYDQNRTQAGYEEGQDLERRTNLLMAGTGVAAALTITLAFLTDWSAGDEREQAPGSARAARPKRASVRLGLAPSGVGVGGSF